MSSRSPASACTPSTPGPTERGSRPSPWSRGGTGGFCPSRTGALVVVDEAYYEFSRSTLAHLTEAYENLVIVRTLSKAFSLAGLRVGYAIAHPSTASLLRSLMPPFLPAPSLAAAAAALEEPGYAREVAETLTREREWLRQRLEMMGLRPYRSWTNFVTFNAARGTAERLLEEHGVAVKEFRLPNGPAVRVTVASPRENRVFVEALAAVMKTRGG